MKITILVGGKESIALAYFPQKKKNIKNINIIEKYLVELL